MVNTIIMVDNGIIPVGIVARHVEALEQGALHRVLSSSSSDVIPLSSRPIATPWRSTTRWVWQDGSPLEWEPAGYPARFDFDESLRDATTSPPWNPRGTLLRDTQPDAAVHDTVAAAGDGRTTNNVSAQASVQQPAPVQPPRKPNDRRRLVQAARALQIATKQDPPPVQPVSPALPRATPAQEADARCVHRPASGVHKALWHTERGYWRWSARCQLHTAKADHPRPCWTTHCATEPSFPPWQVCNDVPLSSSLSVLLKDALTGSKRQPQPPPTSIRHAAQRIHRALSHVGRCPRCRPSVPVARAQHDPLIAPILQVGSFYQCECSQTQPSGRACSRVGPRAPPLFALAACPGAHKTAPPTQTRHDKRQPAAAGGSGLHGHCRAPSGALHVILARSSTAMQPSCSTCTAAGPAYVSTRCC